MVGGVGPRGSTPPAWEGPAQGQRPSVDGLSEEPRRDSLSLAEASQSPDEGGILLVIDGSHIRQMARRQVAGPEIDYVRLCTFFRAYFGVPVREGYFVDTFVESGFEETSLRAAGIDVVLGRMKKANYRAVTPPHHMVAVHCQGGVDSRITGLLLTRGLGLLNELPARRTKFRVERVILVSSDSDFEYALQELVDHGRQVTCVGFTTPGNHILCSVSQSYLDLTRHWDQVRREVDIRAYPARAHAGAIRNAPSRQLSTSASASASASASTSATAARLPPPPAGQVTLVELHLEADDLNRLARTAFVEGQRKDADPDVREHFPSPWKEHLIPGSLARFSAHMSREHSVLTPALVQKLWCHMLRFLPVWGNRNTVLTKHWVEVLVRAAEHGKRSDDDLISQTFRRMDLVTLKRFPCLSSLYVYYATQSYAKHIMGDYSRENLEKVWAFVRGFCPPEQLQVLRKQEYELFKVLYPGHDPGYDKFAADRADSCFASEALEQKGPPSPPIKTVKDLGLEEGQEGQAETPEPRLEDSRTDSMFGEVTTQRALLQKLVSLLVLGNRGQELREALEAPEFDWVTGSVLLLAIFKAVAAEKGRDNRASIAASLSEIGWLSWDQYGTALRAALQDDEGEQACALMVVQKLCSFLGFPRCEDGQPLIDRLFTLLYTHRFIERRVFDVWWEDNRFLDADRLNIVRQTASFFAGLHPTDREEEEEEEAEACGAGLELPSSIPDNTMATGKSPERPPLPGDARQALALRGEESSDEELEEDELVTSLSTDRGVGSGGSAASRGKRSPGLLRGKSDEPVGPQDPPRVLEGPASDSTLLRLEADERTETLIKQRLKQTKSALKLVNDRRRLERFLST